MTRPLEACVYAVGHSPTHSSPRPLVFVGSSADFEVCVLVGCSCAHRFPVIEVDLKPPQHTVLMPF